LTQLLLSVINPKTLLSPIGMRKPSSRSVAIKGEKLRLLRQSLGWTQDFAAQKAGYSARLIRKVESGGKVRPETLVDLIQCYHVAASIEQWDVCDFLNQEPLSAANQQGAIEDQQRQILRMQQWYVTTYNRREVGRVAEFVAPDMRYQHGEGSVLVGVDAIGELVLALLTGFDPMTFEFSHSFFCDDYVHTFWKLKMKHVGVFGDVPATRKWVVLRGNSRVKLVENKMVDFEDNWDVYDVIRQLKGEPPKWF